MDGLEGAARGRLTNGELLCHMHSAGAGFAHQRGIRPGSLAMLAPTEIVEASQRHG